LYEFDKNTYEYEETGKSISKSGINHQLNKNKEKANQYRLINKDDH